MRLELVTRRGCHLCVGAGTALARLGLDYIERDVDSEPELLRLYDFRVPVVLRGGRVIAEGQVDEAALRRALSR